MIFRIIKVISRNVNRIVRVIRVIRVVISKLLDYHSCIQGTRNQIIA